MHPAADPPFRRRDPLASLPRDRTTIRLWCDGCQAKVGALVALREGVLECRSIDWKRRTHRRLSDLSRTVERVDRKTLKEDELLNVVNRATAWVQANMTRALAIGGGAILLVDLLVLWSRSNTRQATEADTSLSQVVAAVAGQQWTPALELATSVQSRYPGSKSAILSSYLAGMCHLRLGRLPEAETALRTYLESADKAPFYSKAVRPALAAALEGQGKFAEAGKLYEEASTGYEEPLASRLKMDAARAYAAAGANEQARALLKTVADASNAETAQLARQAKTELAVLDAMPSAAPTIPSSTP